MLKSLFRNNSPQKKNQLFKNLMFNRSLGHDRMFIMNFFGGWMIIFEISHGRFRGPKSLLKPIIPITIALTNYHIEVLPSPWERTRDLESE
jgi:hypothetical protein